MTTSRIVRGTKIRFFVCFCAIVVILGLIACYNNTVSQLDETQKALELCQQQQENLSTQLQVISDYKLRLEKALKTEKAEHVKSNSSFDQLLKDEKTRNEKSITEANLRFNSLQQRCNLLQTEHDDYKEKLLKTQQEQLDEISDLQSKLKEAQNEIKNVISSKEKLKSDYLNIQMENDNLKRQLEGHELNSVGFENKTNYLQKQNIDLKRELEALKEKCPESRDTIQEPIILKEDAPKISNQDDANLDQRQQNDQNVLQIPNNEPSKKSSSSTQSSKSSSQGSLNGARPLVVPTMTPKNHKVENADVLAKPNANAVPQGVLPVPEKLPDGLVPAEENEIKNNIIDDRYKNKIEESKMKKQEDIDRENMANEDLDQQNMDDGGLNFGDAIKHAERQNFNKEHIDNMGAFREPKNQQLAVGAGDYKDAQVDENAAMDEAEDDDQDEYGDIARHKEPAVRN